MIKNRREQENIIYEIYDETQDDLIVIQNLYYNKDFFNKINKQNRKIMLVSLCSMTASVILTVGIVIKAFNGIKTNLMEFPAVAGLSLYSIYMIKHSLDRVSLISTMNQDKNYDSCIKCFKNMHETLDLIESNRNYIEEEYVDIHKERKEFIKNYDGLIKNYEYMTGQKVNKKIKKKIKKEIEWTKEA